MMTIEDNPKKVSIAKKEGVTEFLYKPATHETLLETVEKIFN